MDASSRASRRRRDLRPARGELIVGGHDRRSMTPPRPTTVQSVALAAAVALLVAGVAATAVTRPNWLFGPHGLLGARGVFAEPPPAAKPAAPDPLGVLSPDLRAFLTHPGLDAPSPFIRLARVDPERFCKALAATGLKNATFQKAEPPLRGWTCVTDLVKPIDGDEARVSSLFVAARGLESDRLDNIRMKLNLLDAATSPIARVVARDVLFQICRSLGFDPPPEVLAQLETLKEGRVYEGGVSWDLKREFGPADRYNLIAIFPRTLFPGGEDRFVSDPRREPVAR